MNFDASKLGDYLGDSNRCIVREYDTNLVCKCYKSPVNYQNEKDIYLLLKDCDFIPKMHYYNDDAQIIIMERLICESVADVDVLPATFKEDMKYIELYLVNKGIGNRSDAFKPEHIFLDKKEKSKETHGVRIIDFDVDVIFPTTNPSKDTTLQSNRFLWW